MLPAATELLWKRLEREPLLAGWYLIGGTALSLTIQHRQSEDLDFVWPGKGPLPVPVIGHLAKQLVAEGWRLERDDDPRADQEFLNAGMDLHDHQQNFVASTAAGNVKLTFFSPDLPLCVLLPKSESGTVIIPPLSLLFQSKALVACSRSALRDWVDLYILMTRHGFTIDDFVAAYEAAGSRLQLDIAFNRLTSGRPRAGDQGIEAIMANPPTLPAMVSFFDEQILMWKKRTATRVMEA